MKCLPVHYVLKKSGVRVGRKKQRRPELGAWIRTIEDHRPPAADRDLPVVYVLKDTFLHVLIFFEGSFRQRFDPIRFDSIRFGAPCTRALSSSFDMCGHPSASIAPTQSSSNSKTSRATGCFRCFPSPGYLCWIRAEEYHATTPASDVTCISPMIE